MKNKKTIALAMAAATVAPMVVPAFAAEKAVVQTPAAQGRFGLDHLNNKRVVRVDKESLTETMRKLEEEGRSPKVVYREKNSKGELQDALVQYTYDWVKEDPSVNADTMAAWKAQYDAAKAFVEYAYSDKAVDASTGAKLYTVKVTERPYSIDLNSTDKTSYVRNAKIVTVTENIAGIGGDTTRRDTYTYTFDGLDTTFEGEEVVVKSTSDIDLTKLNADDLKEQYKRLASVEYNLKQAIKANPDLIVTTEKQDHTLATGRQGLKYTVRIFRKDGITKVGEFKVYTHSNGIDNSLVVKQPSINNDFTGHWAEQTIVNAMLNGVVSTNATYRPKENITRAEFASVIYNTLKLHNKVQSDGSIAATDYFKFGNEHIHFSDVSEGSWYATPVMALAKAGYLNGNPDGTFRPNDPISRQEAAKIMADVIFKNGKETFKTDENGKKLNVDIVTSFADDSTIASWADESVQALVDKTVKGTVIDTLVTGSVVSGDAGKNTFRGKDSISRAEALIMAERAYVAGFQITK